MCSFALRTSPWKAQVIQLQAGQQTGRAAAVRHSDTPLPCHPQKITKCGSPAFCSHQLSLCSEILGNMRNTMSAPPATPQVAKLGHMQQNKGGITIVMPTTAGLMKNAGARVIPWLVSHSTKKTLEKQSITRRSPRTWGRDSKHMLEWTDVAMGDLPN